MHGYVSEKECSRRGWLVPSRDESELKRERQRNRETDRLCWCNKQREREKGKPNSVYGFDFFSSCNPRIALLFLASGPLPTPNTHNTHHCPTILAYLSFLLLFSLLGFLLYIYIYIYISSCILQVSVCLLYPSPVPETTVLSPDRTSYTPFYSPPRNLQSRISS